MQREHWLAALVTQVVLASAGDIAADLAQGANRTRLLQEAVLLSLAVAILLWLWRSFRRQASAIHHKAGVSGRHGLAAWFLEDLLDVGG